MVDMSKFCGYNNWNSSASDVGMKKESVLTLRMSNKLRFGLDMLCRKQNAQQTELIESLMWDAINDDQSGHGLAIPSFISEEVIMDGEKITIPQWDDTYNLLNMLWHENESVRAVNLALFAPELLNMKERKLLAVIRKDKQFWLGEVKYSNKEQEDAGIVSFSDNQPNIPLIRHNWEAIIKKANGEKVVFDFDAKLESDDLPEYPSVKERKELLAKF